MATTGPLASGSYSLQFGDLYARVWELGADQRDGTRVYVSADEAALKWLTQDLTGTPAESGRTLTDNHTLRKLFIAAMLDGGWEDRIGERRYVMLVPPPSGVATTTTSGVELVPLRIPTTTEPASTRCPPRQVTGPSGDLALDGATWSSWVRLSEAVRVATQSLGVYVASVDGQIVYVGMASERKGQVCGVGSLSTPAAGALCPGSERQCLTVR